MLREKKAKDEMTKGRTKKLGFVLLTVGLLFVLLGVFWSLRRSFLPSNTPESVPGSPRSSALATLYFVRTFPTSFTLEGVTRRLPAGAREDGAAYLRAALEALRDGPSEAERAQGLTSAFPAELEVLGIELEDEKVIADLSAAFASGGGTALMRARLEQLFYTLSEPEGVSHVALRLDGEAVEVFSAEGLLLPQPWTRPDGGALPVW